MVSLLSTGFADALTCHAAIRRPIPGKPDSAGQAGFGVQNYVTVPDFGGLIGGRWRQVARYVPRLYLRLYVT